jgi:hypothetical protein
MIAGSFAARSASHESKGSQPSLLEGVLADRKFTRCRRSGERSGIKVGGGRGETKAVGRQASKGGSSSRALGGGGRCMSEVL